MIQMELLKNKFITKVNDKANPIKLLAFVLGTISASMERNLSKYQQLLAGLEHMMDEIDTIFRFAFTYYNSTM